MLPDPTDFNTMKVLFYPIYEFFIEGFVGLGKELLNFELGEFISPQERVLGVVLGLREKCLLKFVELALGEFSEDAVVRVVVRFLNNVVLLGLLLKDDWECWKLLLLVTLTVEIVHGFLC
jgi:hypothetical protein